MPSSAATINRDQRNGIYELVRNHLAGLSDVYVAMEQEGDFATAERLGLEVGEDFRLLRDIGWRPEDDRQEFVLTMPALDRTELLRRLQHEAGHVLLGSGTERQASEQDAETNRRFQLGYHACGELLANFDQPEGESALARPIKASAFAPASWMASSSPTCADTRRTDR